MNEQPALANNTNTRDSSRRSWPGRPAVVFGACVAVVVLVVAGGLAWWQPWRHTTQPAAVKPPTVAVIEITPSGFVPSTVSVAPNTDVVWVNEDVMPHLPAADPYPSHSSLPNLVAPRALGQKETYRFLFTKAQTVHYHDDIDPTLVGTVVVR